MTTDAHRAASIICSVNVHQALLKFTLDSEVMLLDDLPLDLTCPDYLAHAITLHSMDVLATGRQSAFDLQMRNPHTIRSAISFSQVQLEAWKASCVCVCVCVDQFTR